MPRVSAAFFATGALCILCGGAIGLLMSSGRASLYDGVHVHLNLVGWATMALCGTFYAFTGETRFAWINYVVLTAGILLFFPTYVLFLWNGDGPAFLLSIASAGNGLTALGMAIFAVAAFRELFRRRA